MSKTQRQVMRMLALVPYLQDNDGIPVKEVAREFNVPARQIQEDLSLLTLTGVGEFHGELIDYDVDALETHGVIHIRDAEFMERPLRLLTREAIALVMALRALRASAGPSQLPIIDGALAKLESAIGTTGLDAPVDIHVEGADPQVRATVQEGLERGERVEIDYATESRDARSTRTVEPRRLFTDHGHLYLEAWCLQAQDLRFFRLDRVVRARATGQPSDHRDAPPADLSEGFFTPGSDGPSAVLDVDQDAAWLVETYRAEILDPDVDGRIRVRVRAGDESWLRRLVLRHAGTVHVVEPTDLADRVRDDARRALDAYSG